MRSKTVLAILTLLTATSLMASEERIVFGTVDSWSRLLRADRVVSMPGRQGFTDLRLEAFRNEPGADTELLLQFDELPLRDSAGSYGVHAPNAELAPSIARTGRAALLVDDPSDAVFLDPRAGSLFAPGTQWGSFTIDFWLYLARTADGDSFLSWSAREGAAHAWREQSISVRADAGFIVAEFDNFFVRPDGNGVTVRLENRERVIPRRWTHHAIRFTGETGLLEYLVDGRPVAITYVSQTGRQDGSVYYPRIAALSAGGLVVAERMRGAIDEVRVERRVVGDSLVPEYPPAGGSILTDYIDLGSNGARLTGLDASFDAPGLSDVFFYYRITDLQGDQAHVPESEWHPIRPGSPVDEIRGRFVQVRADLYPDTRDHRTPVLSDITVSYEPRPAPLPPVSVRAVPMDGAVRVEWTSIREPGVSGYRVYYGTEPGRYFGVHSDLGASPLDAGAGNSLVIDGLSNGTLYYFAVGVYDAYVRSERYELSVEVAARPGRVYR